MPVSLKLVWAMFIDQYFNEIGYKRELEQNIETATWWPHYCHPCTSPFDDDVDHLKDASHRDLCAVEACWVQVEAFVIVTRGLVPLKHFFNRLLTILFKSAPHITTVDQLRLIPPQFPVSYHLLHPLQETIGSEGLHDHCKAAGVLWVEPMFSEALPLVPFHSLVVEVEHWTRLLERSLPELQGLHLLPSVLSMLHCVDPEAGDCLQKNGPGGESKRVPGSLTSHFGCPNCLFWNLVQFKIVVLCPIFLIAVLCRFNIFFKSSIGVIFKLVCCFISILLNWVICCLSQVCLTILFCDLCLWVVCSVLPSRVLFCVLLLLLLLLLSCIQPSLPGGQLRSSVLKKTMLNYYILKCLHWSGYNENKEFGHLILRTHRVILSCVFCLGFSL